MLHLAARIQHTNGQRSKLKKKIATSRDNDG